MSIELEDYLIETRTTVCALKFLLETIEKEVCEYWGLFIGKNREHLDDAEKLISIIYAAKLTLKHIESVRKKYDEVVSNFYKENL